MKKILSKGSQKLLDWQQEATLKQSIDNSDSQLLSTQGPSNETAQERRVREFLNLECSYEALDSWNVYLKERSQNAANSKKKKV